MRILIDADGCPVTGITEETAFRENIQCLIFCNTSHILESPYAQIIICEKGLDSVDFAILNRCRKNDIVITQDYGLASMCLVKKSFPINQNGSRYTNENIDSLLNSRYISKKARQTGIRTKGPAKRKSEQNEKFRKNLQKLISHIRNIENDAY